MTKVGYSETDLDSSSELYEILKTLLQDSYNSASNAYYNSIDGGYESVYTSPVFPYDFTLGEMNLFECYLSAYLYEGLFGN